jgi:hypothetical protein
VCGLAAGEAEARRMAQQTGGWAVRFVPREEAAALQC